MSFLLTNKRHTEREREETVSDQFLEYCFLKKISDFYRLCILKKTLYGARHFRDLADFL